MRKQHSTDFVIIIIGFFCYFLNRFWLKEMVKTPYLGYFLRCHFNDFLAGILFLACYNFFHSRFFRATFHHDTLLVVLSISLFCGIMWEYVLPFLFKKGVSDFGDIIAYLCGGMMYYFIHHNLKKA